MVSIGIDTKRGSTARRPIRWILGFSTLATVASFSTDSALAATIIVGAGGAPEAPTLSSGVAHASDGDILLVQPGTYSEIIVTSKSLTIAPNGAAGSVVLNANNFGSALAFSNLTGDLVLDGLAIQNGAADRGAGVSIASVSGSVTITDCEFFGNVAERTGGALDIFDAVATIEGCYFEGNAVSGSSELKGGAVSFRGDTDGSVIEDCQFVSNEALFGGAVWFDEGCTIGNSVFDGNDADKGGAIYGTSVSDAVVTECTFESNTAAETGGALYASGSGLVVKYCTFETNVGGTNGGGIYLGSGSNAEILWNVFNGNSAPKGGGVAVAGMLSRLYRNTFYANGASNRGAGIHLQQTSAEINQNIFANSTGSAAVYCEVTSSPSFLCSMMWNNASGHFDGGCDPIDSDGNFVSDPLFCDAGNGDFGVNASSAAASGNEPVECLGGSIGVGGASCGATPAVKTTWGSLKARFQ